MERGIGIGRGTAINGFNAENMGRGRGMIPSIPFNQQSWPDNSAGSGNVAFGRGMSKVGETKTSIEIGRGLILRSKEIESNGRPSTILQDIKNSSNAAVIFGGRGRGIQRPNNSASSMPSLPLGRGRGALKNHATHGTSVPSLDHKPVAEAVQNSEVIKSAQLASRTERLFSELTVDDEIHERGKRGQIVKVASNFVSLKMEQDSIYQYAVTYTPNIESWRMKKSLLREHEEKLTTTEAFDGTVLFLPNKLDAGALKFSSIRKTDGSEIVMALKLVKIIDASSAVQFFNVLFRKVMGSLDLCAVGRNNYNPHDALHLPNHQIEIWPGYVTAINKFDGGLLLNIDVSHKILRSATAYSSIRSIISQNPNRSDYKRLIEHSLIGAIVMTKYNNRTYRVDDIEWSKNPSHTFEKNKTTISYADYYRTAYNLDIQDMAQCLLVHKPKVKDLKPGQTDLIYLIPELCNLTGLSDEMVSNFTVMKDIHAHTRVDPVGRRRVIQTFCRRVNQTPRARQTLAVWGIKLSEDLLSVDGRCLPLEEVFFRDKGVHVSPEADFTRDLKSNRIISSIMIKNWCILSPGNNQIEAKKLHETLLQLSKPMGIHMEKAKIRILSSHNTEEYVRALREEINPSLQIVVMLMPTIREDRYAAVKKVCCIESPIPSQVILTKNLRHEGKIRSVLVKVALQIQAKLGAELWTVKMPPKLKIGCMVVGIDVCHDRTSQKHRSVAAVVSSVNNIFTKWFSTTHNSPELLNGLKISMRKSLARYREVNNSIPDYIIVFRDGVGDGDLRSVKAQEVEQLQEVLCELGTVLPKLVYIIVQKRINARMFRVQGSQVANPVPGTILDHSITRRNQKNFYLVSQHVRQGTVSPTHYIVLSDNSGLSTDVLQGLTYKMTYLYWNWPGTVRVPAPCQYAHKLAGLNSQCLGRPHDAALDNLLYYL